MFYDLFIIVYMECDWPKMIFDHSYTVHFINISLAMR